MPNCTTRCKHPCIHVSMAARLSRMTSSETARVSAVTRRLPRAERRAQLLTAAATAFVRAGFDGTSMEDVAEQAGVTRLIVYRIFATKEDLYRAVLESVTDRLRD